VFVVGITGGIGSGKSAATDYLQLQGITVVDADLASRIIVEPGKPALATLANTFGSHLIQSDGTLDRRALRNVVFADATKLKQLEAITHPAIADEIRQQLAQSRSPYTVLVSPLLLETAQHEMTNRILLIDAPEALQIARASQRDQASSEQIRAIIAKQMSRKERQQRSHDIVLNDGNLEKLHQAIYALHQQYLSLATHHV